MPGPSRNAWIAWVAGCAVALACSGASSPVQSCTTSAQCPANARCISSACVANAAPSAAVALPPAPIETNVLLSFDASASADPDAAAGDSVASFAWAFRALSGQACAVPAVASTGPMANVRFGCPGRYAIDVTATDDMGAAATATREFDVTAHAGSLVTVGDDVATDHACTSEPRCAPVDPVTLSAGAPGTTPGQVSFAWTVVPPPDRPLTATRRVSFLPSATIAAPSVLIETDGDAISGDWIFRVEATDSAGSLGTQDVRVVVKNRLPVLTKLPSAVPAHTFDGSKFAAAGEVGFTVSDPDGDPLAASPEWRHTGDGASAFTGTLLSNPPRVSFAIEVPYSVRSDALKLIGGAGLERTILLDVSDGNGGKASASWSIVVGNNPPVLGGTPAPFSIDHGFDAGAQTYVADVPLSTWSDPDGDPLFQAGGTGDLLCPDLAVVGGTAHALCRMPFTGILAVANFIGSHTVVQAVQDPWAPAAATSTATFTLLNRAPRITSTATYVAGDGLCSGTTTCCQLVDTLCESYWWNARGVEYVPARWDDPDGDPVSVTAGAAAPYTPRPLVCTSPSCWLAIDIAQTNVCNSSPVVSLPMTVSDGLALALGALPIEVTCYVP